MRLTGQREGEIQAGEHDGREDPPAEHAHHERQSGAGDLTRLGGARVALREMPVGGGEEAEGGDEQAEDADEDEVGAQRADGVDEAEHGHEDEEEGPGRIECGRLETCRRVVGVGGEVAVGAGLRLEGQAESDPEGAEGGEDDAGEGVAEDPLEEVVSHEC